MATKATSRFYRGAALRKYRKKRTEARKLEKRRSRTKR